MMRSVISARQLYKKFKNFQLTIPELVIPKGFATALIGENGAGKSTLMHILAGTRLDYQGELCFFEQYNDKDREKPDCKVRERIGYIGPNHYFMPHWTVKQIADISSLLFEGFHADAYRDYCSTLGITAGSSEFSKKVSELSDGTRMKLMLSAVFARDTDCLLMDEPASPLDPLMRDRLCDLIRTYIESGSGERSVFFSTHNISDMENVTDYAIIMEQGRIVEAGFVEDLKEKYILVKGEKEEEEAASRFLYSKISSAYGFEGVCLAENLDRLAGMHIITEIPTLSQISVAIMKANTSLKLG